MKHVWRDDEPRILEARINRAKRVTGWTTTELKQLLEHAAGVMELARLHGVIADPGGFDVVAHLLEAAQDDTWLRRAAKDLALIRPENGQ